MAQQWPAWLTVGMDKSKPDPELVSSEGGQMWIAIDGAQHKTYVDVSKMCRLYVARVGSGNYKVVGQLGDADLALKLGLGSEAEAQDWLEELVRNIMS